MVNSDTGFETPANLKDIAQGENKEQLHFYFAYEEAVAIRAKAIKKLLGKIWKPWNAEIIDIDIVPNRITAKRLHFADHRFGSDPVWGPGDTRKYNTDAKPRPQDYAEGVKFDEEMKKNPPAANYPAGFVVPDAPPTAIRKANQ